jgi:uncharacterized membrane protein YphA (DoxX/SURF4 family)
MNWFGNQKGEGFEYHLLAIGLALIVLIHGGGQCALVASTIACLRFPADIRRFFMPQG